MERSRARWFCVMGAVCSLSLATAASAAGDRSNEPERLDLPENATASGVVIFRARSPGVHPLTVLLHGMCGDAARTCRHFTSEVTESAHLICPRASVPCAGGGASWPERGVEEAIEDAVLRAKAELGESVDDAHGRTLIGYSMGAFRALRIAEDARGRYPRVMLIGAKIAPDRARLEDNGVQRLLLCAGDWDMMHDHMQRASERLRGAAIRVRFLSLGKVGHGLTPSFSSYLPEALSFLHD